MLFRSDDVTWEEHRFNEVGTLLLTELLKLGCGYVDFTIPLCALLCVFENALGFPGGTSSKETACNAGDSGLILEEGIGTPSSILAWRIPWTEEPGRPQSIGSHRVGHD